MVLASHCLQQRSPLDDGNGEIDHRSRDVGEGCAPNGVEALAGSIPVRCRMNSSMDPVRDPNITIRKTLPGGPLGQWNALSIF
jgi:hypothetical protein